MKILPLQVEMSSKIKMLGHLHCEGCMIWKEPKVRFLILYEREKEELDHEIGKLPTKPHS